jgi:hypothetical protein
METKSPTANRSNPEGDIMYLHRDGTEVTTKITSENATYGSAKTTTTEPCSRCCGQGHIWNYGHVMNGVCFACNGRATQSKVHKVYTAERLAKLDAAKAKRDAAKEAKRIERLRIEGEENRKRLAAFLEEHGALLDAASKLNDSFAKDVCRTALEKMTLTDRQRDALQGAIDRAAQDATAADCPTGRIQITGTIATVKFQDSQYGGSYKMLVKTEAGFKVWGTVPSNLYGYAEGTITELLDATVTMTATIEPSRDDAKFGFYKRPTKATAEKAGRGLEEKESRIANSSYAA